MYAEAIGQCCVCFVMISTLVLEAGSLMDPEAHQLARPASQQALESAFLYLLSVSITDLLHSGFTWVLRDQSREPRLV